MISRRTFLIGAPVFITVPAFATAPKRRSLSIVNFHTGEYLPETVYEQDGLHDGEALDRIFRIFRDWRRDEYAVVDPKVLAIISDLRDAVRASDRPVHLICGYRSPETNRRLAQQGRSVSWDSLHTKAMAADLVIEGVPLETMRSAALGMKRGGVGYYPRDQGGFIHVDSGRVRSW